MGRVLLDEARHAPVGRGLDPAAPRAAASGTSNSATAPTAPRSQRLRSSAHGGQGASVSPLTTTAGPSTWDSASLSAPPVPSGSGSIE
jgi:hypothetical protein